MSITPASVISRLKNDNTILASERERKTRLLRLFCLIAIWIEPVFFSVSDLLPGVEFGQVRGVLIHFEVIGERSGKREIWKPIHQQKAGNS